MSLLEETKKQFADPSPAYRPQPFWFLNHDYKREELEWQLEEMRKQGVGGVVLHSRHGKSAEYMSREYLDMLAFCVDACKKRDMVVWLYDEDNWPSGTFGGKLTRRHPEYRMRYLRLEERRLAGGAETARLDFGQNARLELNHFQHVTIDKYVITRVDKERLLRRGGDRTIGFDSRVGIIGCGSIGSQIASALSEVGMHKLLLIDNDKLTFENIARHICGASDVGKNKVEAVSEQIASRFPHSQNTVYHGDVLTLLRDYESLLNNCDFTVVAVGNMNAEFRLNNLQRQGIIDKPILYVWVEPYLAGAHAVFVDPANTGCLQCLFNEDHTFKQTVLDNPGQYAIRESGCQSAYVPYSILEVKRFINDLMFLVQDILAGSVKENVLFTWFGNLTMHRASGRQISPQWEHEGDYGIKRDPISSFTGCEVCIAQ
ncbi:ThiF family adenylyltransferase [Paenibacillus arenilitoris]|uniref:ThiF family adenylyltransferase n=1 Tax=Paenibacillus arenilitoris TaxID=2772299 RepID=A0A927CJL4_9BACL|nr:ThiF family adenylyltransferase [Paenibacillus arenilitoris]MBD2869293.1 ThiF family adenylyltransferase [Paenibacillus arenilitoris]